MSVLTTGPLGPVVTLALLATLAGRVLLEATAQDHAPLHHRLGVAAVPLMVVFLVVVVARFATAW